MNMKLKPWAAFFTLFCPIICRNEQMNPLYKIFMWIGLISVLFCNIANASDASPIWAVYQNATYGYQILYPEGWKAVEAKPRINSGTVWSGHILCDGELQKVTFIEQKFTMWRGEFEIRVLKNEKKVSLNEWIEAYDIKAINDDSLITETSEATLGDKPAKMLKVFMFDHQGIEIIALNGDYIYIVSFAGRNPNDPNLQYHKKIYDHMVSGFKFE